MRRSKYGYGHAVFVLFLVDIPFGVIRLADVDVVSVVAARLGVGRPLISIDSRVMLDRLDDVVIVACKDIRSWLCRERKAKSEVSSA